MIKKLKSGFPPQVFDKLSKQEDASWWFLSRNEIIIWAIQRYAKNFKDFLEIGCGTGFVLHAINKTFPGSHLFGDEYYKEGLEHAKKRVPDASFRCLDATQMHDKDCYDAIGAFDVIEHIEDDRLALLRCFHALKRDGYLFLTVPQHMWLWSELDDHSCHVRRYSKLELIQKVEQTGFRFITSSSFISFLVPIMWLSRKGLSQNKDESRTELNPSPWLNAFFRMVMKLEILLLRFGVRFPIGGSLLLVAKKP
jgi:SAM-dependent methyltransferase